MNREEANQTITEAMGMCWHNVEVLDVTYTCIKCGKHFYYGDHYKNPNYNFFTADKCFNSLWPWMRDDSKHRWKWEEFECWLIPRVNYVIHAFDGKSFIDITLIDHYADEGGFVMLAAEWLREKR